MGVAIVGHFTGPRSHFVDHIQRTPQYGEVSMEGWVVQSSVGKRSKIVSRSWQLAWDAQTRVHPYFIWKQLFAFEGNDDFENKLPRHSRREARLIRTGLLRYLKNVWQRLSAGLNDDDDDSEDDSDNDSHDDSFGAMGVLSQTVSNLVLDEKVSHLRTASLV
jgi:hypothetical protein